MTIKVELVDNVQKVKKKINRKRVTCKCGKEMTDSAFLYHKLRCEVCRNDEKSPYPVEKMSSKRTRKVLASKIDHHKLTNDGKWIKKLVYQCKIGEGVKISVPDHKEAQRICQLWRYYVTARKLIAIVKINKTWKGKNVFLSMRQGK
jgi:hypothetical protein